MLALGVEPHHQLHPSLQAHSLSLFWISTSSLVPLTFISLLPTLLFLTTHTHTHKHARTHSLSVSLLTLTLLLSVFLNIGYNTSFRIN